MAKSNRKYQSNGVQVGNYSKPIKGFKHKICLACKKKFYGSERRVTCSPKCSRRYRNGYERTYYGVMNQVHRQRNK